MMSAVPTLAGMHDDCFHCGLPLPAGATGRFAVTIDGASRATCCAGCQAVAGLIAGQGLQAYYRARTQYDLAPARSGTGHAHVDHPEIQAGYVMHRADGLREAALFVDRVTCAACLWLIEHRLCALDGVREVRANAGTRRLRVAWDDSRVKLSAILDAIAALGYRAELYDARRSEAALLRERRDLLWRFFVAAFGMMQVMMYALPGYFGEDAMPRDIERLMQWAGFMLTTPVLVFSCAPFLRGALRGLLARTLNRDVPVSLGILAAYAASTAALLRGTGEVYFDSIAMFACLLLAARYVELSARMRAARELDRVATLVPPLALRLKDYPASQAAEEIPAALLTPGNVIEIRPGAAIPADAEVIEGESRVNEALLTGESTWVARKPGGRLLAGSVNEAGLLRARVTAAGSATTVAGIVRLMDRALGDKPGIASLADRAASWFVLGLIVCAALGAAAWNWVDPARVVPVTVALLIVTCPCALTLATPAALIAATGALARRGVLITRGHALETLARATHFVFDKTGTLTDGRMRLIGVIPLGAQGMELVQQYAAALERTSPHPVARALAALPTRFEAEDVVHHTGEGVEGCIGSVPMRLGTPAFAARWNHLPLPRELVFVADGVQVVALATQTEWLALFTLGDTPRSGARHVVQSLMQHGARVSLLSGDRVSAVAGIARSLGIARFHGEALPADKVGEVQRLQAAGAVVAAVGDGVNDAPLLAQAQVSVAMAGATDLSRQSADVLLMTDRIEPLLDAVTTARKTMRVIRQNLAWAGAYNAVAVPLAMLGLVTPLLAAAGMAVSSLIVVANAMRAGH
jgi:Cu2+-exporting ATPase